MLFWPYPNRVIEFLCHSHIVCFKNKLDHQNTKWKFLQFLNLSAYFFFHKVPTKSRFIGGRVNPMILSWKNLLFLVHYKVLENQKKRCFTVIMVIYCSRCIWVGTAGRLVKHSLSRPPNKKGADLFHAKILFYICTGANGF